MLPPALRGRRVYRAPVSPGTERAGTWRGIDSEEHDEQDFGGYGVKTTAGDLAVFAQTLLNGGAYGGRRVVSRASVAAMTRNQLVGGIGAVLPWFDATGARLDIDLGSAAYGYGLYTFGPGDRFIGNGALMSDTAFGHVGNGGSCFWADPHVDLLGVCLSVSPRLHRNVSMVVWDLFQNAVHAAVADA